mmetsp:Transcript_5298/g.13527  ORF Transcript_5298/g.13527 Transcript_5298/m.13527 type:complete len:597 (-) Transcript_5298:600-2390(-)
MGDHPLASLHGAAVEWKNLALVDVNRRADALGLAWRLSQQIETPVTKQAGLAVSVLQHAKAGLGGVVAVGLPWLQRRVAQSAHRRMLAATAAKGAQTVVPGFFGTHAVLLGNIGIGGAQIAILVWQHSRKKRLGTKMDEKMGEVFMRVQSSKDGLCLQPSAQAGSLYFDSCGANSALWQWHFDTRRLTARDGQQLYLRHTTSAARLCLDRWCIRCLTRGDDAMGWAFCARESEPVALLPREPMVTMAWGEALVLVALFLAALASLPLWRRASSSVSESRLSGDESQFDLQIDEGFTPDTLLNRGSWTCEEDEREAHRQYLKRQDIVRKMETINANINLLAKSKQKMLQEMTLRGCDDMEGNILEEMDDQVEELRSWYSQTVTWSHSLFGDSLERCEEHPLEDCLSETSTHPHELVLEETAGLSSHPKMIDEDPVFCGTVRRVSRKMPPQCNLGGMIDSADKVASPHGKDEAMEVAAAIVNAAFEEVVRATSRPAGEVPVKDAPSAVGRRLSYDDSSGTDEESSDEDEDINVRQVSRSEARHHALTQVVGVTAEVGQVVETGRTHQARAISAPALYIAYPYSAHPFDDSCDDEDLRV